MAYQKVGTPRFYVDWSEYLKSMNLLYNFDNYTAGISTLSVIGRPGGGDAYWESISNNSLGKNLLNVAGLNPHLPTIFPHTGFESDEDSFYLAWQSGAKHDFDDLDDVKNSLPNYVAILNHNFASSDVGMIVGNDSQAYYIDSHEYTNIINFENSNNFGSWGGKDGFSIAELDLTDWNPDETNIKFKFTASGTSFDKDIYVGSICWGRYYDMPVNPDLNLSMSIEYDGSQEFKTSDGSTITQLNYNGSPWWYDNLGKKREPWAIGSEELASYSSNIVKRSGRRTWDLSFSYMKSTDLLPSNYLISRGEMRSIEGYEIEDIRNFPNENIITNSDFSSGGSGWVAETDEITFGSGVATWNPSSNFGTPYLRQENVFDPYIDTNLIFTVKYTETGGSSNTGYLNKIKIGVEEFKLRSEFGTNDDFVLGEGETVDIEKTFTMPAGSYFGAGGNHFTIEPRPGFRGTVDNLQVVLSPEIDNIHNNDINTDDSMIAQLINRVSHGEKFIFQPDNTANNPSDFAICVLDQKSFEMKRVATNVYDVKMKIREVW